MRGSSNWRASSTSVRRYNLLALDFPFYSRDIPILLQEVDKFRELYVTEQEQKLNIESELKDCKV